MNKPNSKSAASLLSEGLRVLIGSAIYAAGFQFFLYHNAIPIGGISGIAMILNFLTKLPVGVMTIVLNIPIFLIAWKIIGLRFIIASAVGMAVSSVFIDLFALTPLSLTQEPLLACLFGGTVQGVGLGVIYGTGATTGGVDVIAKLLRRKYQYINFGTLIFLLDAVICVLFGAIFGMYDSAMYGMVSMFISSEVVDFVLYGATTGKLCYIISDESEHVKDVIVSRLGRGVTILKGKGAYTGNEKQVLLCAVKRQEAMKLRKIVRESDENAFLIFTDAREVYGNGFTNLDSQD